MYFPLQIHLSWPFNNKHNFKIREFSQKCSRRWSDRGAWENQKCIFRVMPFNNLVVKRYRNLKVRYSRFSQFKDLKFPLKSCLYTEEVSFQRFGVTTFFYPKLLLLPYATCKNGHSIYRNYFYLTFARILFEKFARTHDFFPSMHRCRR